MTCPKVIRAQFPYGGWQPMINQNPADLAVDQRDWLRVAEREFPDAKKAIYRAFFGVVNNLGTRVNMLSS